MAVGIILRVHQIIRDVSRVATILVSLDSRFLSTISSNWLERVPWKRDDQDSSRGGQPNQEILRAVQAQAGMQQLIQQLSTEGGVVASSSVEAVAIPGPVAGG